MKTSIYSILLLIFIACNKNNEDPLVTPAPLATSVYHLQVSKVWGNETSYLPNEKVLSFDSLTKKVTVSGSSKDFHPNGVYPYRFYDTTVYIVDPRTWKDIPQELTSLIYCNF